MTIQDLKNQDDRSCPWRIGLKLRGIGYLMERRGGDPLPPLPNYMESIHRGIGMIVSELGEDIAEMEVRK